MKPIEASQANEDSPAEQDLGISALWTAKVHFATAFFPLAIGLANEVFDARLTPDIFLLGLIVYGLAVVLSLVFFVSAYRASDDKALPNRALQWNAAAAAAFILQIVAYVALLVAFYEG